MKTKLFQVPPDRMGVLKVALTLLGCEFQVNGSNADGVYVSVDERDTKAMTLLLEASKKA